MCFGNIFRLQVKEGSHTKYSQEVSICSPGTPKKEMNLLQKQQIIVPLSVDETSEGCKSFVMVQKSHGEMWLCLDPARLKKINY